ncbi:MAG: hypothetical protein ACXWV6_03135 [Chitinophagaceae bacterium]
MKKIAIISSAALLLFTAAVNAQTDTVPKQTTDPVAQQPVATEQQTTAKVYNDKYNNWSADTYKMQPMPEALTTEKIFPVIGNYQLTDKNGTASTVTVTLDPANKGIVWIEGLPQGKIKATLRKSPATYKIPAQPLGEDVMSTEATAATEVDAKDAKKAKATKNVKPVKKELPEGVLIYDRDANVMNVCIGCKYSNEDPAAAFMSTETTEVATTDEAAKAEKKTSKTTKKTTKAKVAKIKPVHYTGTKVIETPAAPATEVQQ